MNLNISKINPIYNSQRYKISKKDLKFENPKNGDLLSFLSNISEGKKSELKLNNNKELELFRNFIYAEGKVTQEEYENIKKNYPFIIARAKNYCEARYPGSISPKDLAYVVLKTDKYLKEKYKEDYRIISLGTSPSPLTEQLSNLGHEVIFLPVSGFKGCEVLLSNLEESKELHAALEYLKFKGLDDNKLNIVLDYTASGSTLNYMTKYIKEYFSLPSKKIVKIPVQDLLKSAFNEKNRLFTQDRYIVKTKEAKALSNDMCNSDTEKITNVPHFPILQSKVVKYKNAEIQDTIYLSDVSSNEDLFKSFENFSIPLARAFSLSVMDEIDKLINL